MESTDTINTRRIMGVFAHPDDAAYLAGGALARWANEGANITLVVATSGDKGSADLEMLTSTLVRTRQQEERNAAKVLGIQNVIFLDYLDGELTPNLGLRRDITRLIRLNRPNMIVTLDPTLYWHNQRYNHSDHRAIGEATLDAIFPAARDHLHFPELAFVEGLPTHKTLTVLIARPSTPTLEIDITDTIENKIKAICEHKSQFDDCESLATRIRNQSLDPETADTEMPRYVEYYHVLRLRK